MALKEREEVNMNKQIITILTSIILLLSFTNCDKDYRDKYTGDWDFVVRKCDYSHSHGSDDDYLEYDIISCAGKISLANVDNKLKIEYMDSISLIVDIVESGKFKDREGRAVGGQFEGRNKIEFRAYVYKNIDHSVKGTKRKKGGEK
jgi:hypothetical protein